MKPLTKDEIISWLKERDEKKLETLWKMADEVRREYVGDAVHRRGLLEISNYCVRACQYCGINVQIKDIPRYRMSRDEILTGVKKSFELGYGTVVMQAGEDYGMSQKWISDIVRAIKANWSTLAVTLSLGERPFEDLKAWREAGADRYLLRFETSDPALYELIHPTVPNSTWKERFEILEALQSLDYETGSGVMIGIPGQRYDILADDILHFQKMDLDMIGVGPYIPDPATPLGSGKLTPSIIDSCEQVECSELMTYKVIALTRLVCPEANIPSTTALASLNKAKGREYGLMRGANIVMPNVTPTKYREQYQIYPGKACLNETAEQCQSCLVKRILSVGRQPGRGQGSRKKSIVQK